MDQRNKQPRVAERIRKWRIEGFPFDRVLSWDNIELDRGPLWVLSNVFGECHDVCKALNIYIL